MIENCKLGVGVLVYHENLVNLYGCAIGDFSTVGPFVEIQKGVKIGKLSKISSHVFICEGVSVGNRVFIGHGVTFTNDFYPGVINPFVRCETVIEDDVSIGSGCTILPVTIGKKSLVGAGSVVTKDIPPYSIVHGNPARVIRVFESSDEQKRYIEQKCNGLRTLSRQRTLDREVHSAMLESGAR